jgi:two-component system, OmpR family, sensor histidine kinase VanS
MKIKISITKKLFIITSIIFAIFIGSTLIVQSLFFERFYIAQKKNDLSSSIEKFKTNYNKEEDEEKSAELIREYEENYNMTIMILNRYNKIKFITGPTKDRSNIGRVRQLADFISLWAETPGNLSGIRQSNKNITSTVKGRAEIPSSVINITPNNEKEEVIFALSSLQPVNEAVSVIEKLYVYFCIAALFFIIILSLINSKMIAKPLIRINRVSKKMAQFDFSEKCAVTSEDEIGSVADSLNFLSENLYNALNSLKQANAKLEEDIEKERQLERMRKEFVASVSHELKTPISLIDGYAEGLKDDIFEGADRDYYLDIIIDETKKMGNLVSDMLDLSQLESGYFKLNKDEFNLADLIRFTLNKYETMIKEKNISMAIRLLEGVRVYADWNRLEQVITNFITNAIRHVNDNGDIYVNMVDMDKEISVEFENTGSSIPEEELLKVWDKFYKIDKSRNRSLGGTGIGLSIVKNVLALHSYTFGAFNTEAGVKFYFRVPKRQEGKIN